MSKFLSAIIFFQLVTGGLVLMAFNWSADLQLLTVIIVIAIISAILTAFWLSAIARNIYIDEQTKILEQILNLDNLDILSDDEVIGAIRLSVDNDEYYLRDLQVSEEFRNKGIGAAALSEVTRLALASGVRKIKLRVFKISPAHHLYKRNGFTLISEDEKFYYMEQAIS